MIQSQTTHHSLLTTQWMDQPQSNISNVSKTVAFYSTHDLPAIANSSNDNRFLIHSSPEPLMLNHTLMRAGGTTTGSQKLSPGLTLPMKRCDSGYATATNLSLSRAVTKTSARSTRSTRDHRPKSSRTSIQSPRNLPTRTHRARSHSHLQCHNPRLYNSPPNISIRHTIPSHTQQQNQFFYFPSFAPIEITPDRLGCSTPPPPPPPPSTTHYWTSNSSRRLEYAAIDAASSGVRGFLVRLVPDCILPAKAQRTKFWRRENECKREGSVRRYRLALPDEGDDNDGVRNVGFLNERKCDKKRPSLIRKWSNGLKFGRR